MHNFSSINILNALDNLPVVPVNSPSLLKDVPPPAMSFNNILQEHLNNANPINNESNLYKNSESINIENSNSQKVSEKQERPVDYSTKSVEITDNKTTSLNKEKENESSKAVREDIQKTEESKASLKSKNINEDEKTEQKEKVAKDFQGNKINKKSGENSSEISSLLSEIASILDMIKNLNPDKKQIQEIKSVLSEIKTALEAKPDKNPADKNTALTANGQELKKLLDKLKNLLGTANRKDGIANIKDIKTNEVKTSENIAEASEIAVLKKQLSKLSEEIRQYVNNQKFEHAVSKHDDIVNDNKNPNNQKIFSEVQSGEKNDGAPSKDGSSNYNFSFTKRDVENTGAAFSKNGMPGTEKRNAFGDELNTIMQNAKIVVRDSKNGSFSIRMQPESLGRVNVNLNLEHGVLVGKFLVDNHAAREAVLENIQSMIDRLQESGITVGGFNVNVRDENKPQSDYNREPGSKNFGLKQVIEAAGAGYESNESYIHNGAIDMVV